MALRLEDIGDTVDKLALACIEFLRSNPEAYQNMAEELGCTIQELEALYTFVTQLREEELDQEWDKACELHGLEDWRADNNKNFSTDESYKSDNTYDATLNDPIHWNPPLLSVKLKH